MFLDFAFLSSEITFVSSKYINQSPLSDISFCLTLALQIQYPPHQALPINQGYFLLSGSIFDNLLLLNYFSKAYPGLIGIIIHSQIKLVIYNTVKIVFFYQMIDYFLIYAFCFIKHTFRNINSYNIKS